MKVFKRNAVIITVLLFVCVAVYLNWSYEQKSDALADDNENAVGTEVLSGEASDQTLSADEDAGLYYSKDASASSDTDDRLTEYFASVRLERSQARDEASTTLQTVASSEGASQSTVDEALAKMTQIASWTAEEAELENLINAKGFIDCVVYLSEDGVSVTVAAEEGLSNVDVAKITDVIVTETDFSADQLKVIEIK